MGRPKKQPNEKPAETMIETPTVPVETATNETKPVEKRVAKKYTMLANVRHDGVLYKLGDEVSLEPTTAKLFQSKNWVQ